ncbi:MAG: hypothetical protein ACPIOQ_42105, partial [Promethearchaeia archaeon]
MGLDTLAEQQAWLSDLAAAVQGLASQARTHARTDTQTHTHTHTHTIKCERHSSEIFYIDA